MCKSIFWQYIVWLAIALVLGNSFSRVHVINSPLPLHIYSITDSLTVSQKNIPTVAVLFLLAIGEFISVLSEFIALRVHLDQLLNGYPPLPSKTVYYVQA